MLRKYWRSVHRRAAKEAAAILGLDSRGQIVIKTLMVVAVLLVLAFLGSEDAAHDEIIVRSVIAGLIIFLFPMIYLYKLFSVPAQMAVEQQRAVETLEQQVKPRLKLQFDPSRHVILHETGRAGTFRVEAVNNSQKTIVGVNVRIVAITSATKELTADYQKFVGLNLALTVDPTTERQPYGERPRDVVDLYPGGHQMFDFVRLVTRGHPIAIRHSNFEWNRRIQRYEQIPRGDIPSGDLEIVLIATSPEANSERTKFIIKTTEEAFRLILAQS